MISRDLFFWSSRGLLLGLVVVTGCSPAAPPVAETPPPPVSVSQPIVREVIDHDDYDGRVAAVETVEVRAGVRGHVVKVNFQDGQMVKAGEMLLEIDPRPYKAALDGCRGPEGRRRCQLGPGQEGV